MIQAEDVHQQACVPGVGRSSGHGTNGPPPIGGLLFRIGEGASGIVIGACGLRPWAGRAGGGSHAVRIPPT